MDTDKIERLFDIIFLKEKEGSRDDALAYKINSEWIKYSNHDLVNIANKVSMGLVRMGVGKNDKIAIISPNRPEWNFIDFGCQQIGAITVPIYPTITVHDIQFILEQAEVKFVFAADYDLMRKVKIAAREVKSVKRILTFDVIEKAEHWSLVKKEGEHEDLKKLAQYRSQVNYNDIVTIIYTSGTTGVPKGVMLSHGNIISNVLAVYKISSLKNGDYRALSFLPLCHIFERTGVYFYLFSGIAIYYAENLEKIGANLKEIKPHTFTTVPRLLEKIYEKILSKAESLSGFKKSLFYWALAMGLKYEPNERQKSWDKLKLKIANKLIFSKWREALGGNVIYIAVGAAALQQRLTRVFWAAKIKILEAYGATETSPGITFSTIEDFRIGCVGPLLDGVEIKFAEDGEILAKGPNIMQGYYKRPDLTKQVIEDGWYHTGDIGEMVEEKFLKITDRKKEIFKTSGGKYIAPQVLENKFKESEYIEQIMVVGEGEKFPGALIIPNFIKLESYCKRKALVLSDYSEMIKHELVNKLFDNELEKLNEGFAQYEKIKKYSLLTIPWSIETNELTPTMKLKRKIILGKYQSLIDDLYLDEKSH